MSLCEISCFSILISYTLKEHLYKITLSLSCTTSPNCQTNFRCFNPFFLNILLKDKKVDITLFLINLNLNSYENSKVMFGNN
jgi:hypothetical protein